MQADGQEREQWARYVRWMTACWQGQVKEVIEELEGWQQRYGKPCKQEETQAMNPKVLVKEALSYLKNNEQRMNYPRYRQMGLPCTSSLAESLVGQFNARVKSSEKFWERNEGAEVILQLRAAYLSEDDRLARYFALRPGNPKRRYSS